MPTHAKQILSVGKKKVVKKKPAVKACNLLSCGSTLLNLALSNNPYGAFLKGKYYFMVGDSRAGKTITSMTTLAEAAHQAEFEDYRLILDNVEDGMLMDVQNMFGQKTADRLEPPAVDEDGEPVSSYTIQDFYYHVDDCVKRAKEEGRPFIYILDSMDGLTSTEDEEKFEEQKKASREGKETSGTYGMGKAKANSSGLRKVVKGLKDTGSILLVIAQTRDNVKFGFNPRTRAGGHALRFYATTEVWTSVVGSIQKTIRGKKRKIGSTIKVAVQKNRITGREHVVEMEIYPSYGIDDLSSMVDFLIDEKHWKVVKKTITAPEFRFKGTKDALIKKIEEGHLERKLQTVTGKVWREVIAATSLKRRKRYED